MTPTTQPTNNYIPADFSEIQKRINSDKNGGYWGGYYKPGVFSCTPTQKKSFTGRILPAYDYSLSQADFEFKTSWGAYRNIDNVDPQTGQPVLASFFAVASCYSWFGNKQVSFLSPTTLRTIAGISRGPELTDPVLDLRNYAKKHADPAVRALTEREEQKKDSKIILPYAQKRYIFNTYGTVGVDRTYKNYLVDVSQKAFEDLAMKLAEWRPSHEAVHDANWPNYLFGDITNPDNGLSVITASIPSNPQPFNGFMFTSGSHKSLKGTTPMPVPEAALAGRYKLYGEENVFKIMSAQEIVDFLVEDRAVPYYLIQEVCSNYCNVPPEPKRSVMYSGGSPTDDEEARAASAYTPPIPVAATSPRPAPPPPPPAPTPPPPPPPAPKAVVQETKYWVSVDGAVLPAPVAKSALADVLNANIASNPSYCAVGDTTWHSHAELQQAAKPAAPPPPPAPTAKPADDPPPWETVVSTTPTSTPPKVEAKASAAVQELKGLTPEEKEDMQNILRRLNEASPEEMTRYVRYLSAIQS